MLLDDEGKSKTYNMKKEADSMKKKADSMKKETDSMKKEADSMKKETDSMKKETDSMKEKDELEECLVCFDTISNKKYVVCKLCNRKCHKDCYNRFVRKNPFFSMKCFQCQTKSINFKKKKRYISCCFC